MHWARVAVVVATGCEPGLQPSTPIPADGACKTTAATIEYHCSAQCTCSALGGGFVGTFPATTVLCGENRAGTTPPWSPPVGTNVPCNVNGKAGYVSGCAMPACAPSLRDGAVVACSYATTCP